MAHQTIAEFQSQRLLPPQKANKSKILGTRPKPISDKKQLSTAKQYLLDAIANQLRDKYELGLSSDSAIKIYNKWLKSSLTTALSNTTKTVKTIQTAKSKTLQKFLYHLKRYA